MTTSRDRSVLMGLLILILLQTLLTGLTLYEVHELQGDVRRLSSAGRARESWERGVERRISEQEETVYRVLPHVEATLTRVLQQIEQ